MMSDSCIQKPSLWVDALQHDVLVVDVVEVVLAVVDLDEVVVVLVVEVVVVDVVVVVEREVVLVSVVVVAVVHGTPEQEVLVELAFGPLSNVVVPRSAATVIAPVSPRSPRVRHPNGKFMIQSPWIGRCHPR
jgi:hypothetical protein